MEINGTKLKIGPYLWTIIEKSEKDFKDMGETVLDKLTVTLRENLPKDVKIVTLIHELLHSTFQSGGICPKQEELIVDFLASQIFIFVKQNPEFIQYLNQQINS